MSDIVTITGTVATDPQRATTRTGQLVLNFRLASSQRRFDQRTGGWVDFDTNWYSVAAFRTLAEHVADSVRIGDRVIVTGQLRIRAWTAGEKSGTSIDIHAEAIGHDLRFGRSVYQKRAKSGAEKASLTAIERHDPADSLVTVEDVDVDVESPTPF